MPTASEICHKNPFPKDEVIFWFWNTSTLQCRLFYQHFRRQNHPETLFVLTTHSKKRSGYKHHHFDLIFTLWEDPDKTRHQETPSFRPHPLGLTHFIKIPSGKHLEAILFGLHSLELTLFKHMSPQTQAQSSLHRHSRNSTVNTSILPPPLVDVW